MLRIVEAPLISLRISESKTSDLKRVLDMYLTNKGFRLLSMNFEIFTISGFLANKTSAHLVSAGSSRLTLYSSKATWPLMAKHIIIYKIKKCGTTLIMIHIEKIHKGHEIIKILKLIFFIFFNLWSIFII